MFELLLLVLRVWNLNFHFDFWLCSFVILLDLLDIERTGSLFETLYHSSIVAEVEKIQVNPRAPGRRSFPPPASGKFSPKEERTQ